jgi:replication-associated recombination protein RarA
MLSAGEDPLYVARRMIRFASEDIGNAAPGALPVRSDSVMTAILSVTKTPPNSSSGLTRL